MAKHTVEAPIDKVKELILQEYPSYYNLKFKEKLVIVREFVKPMCHSEMYYYMEKTKDGEVDG